MSDTGLFKVNRANLTLARAAIREYGECWLHGCGNIYATKEDSDFRKEFTNPNPDKTPPASAYVLHLTRVSQVPGTPEEAEEALLKSKAQEARESQRQKSISKVRTLSVTEDDIHDNDEGDEEFAKQVIPQQLKRAVRPAIPQTAAQATREKDPNAQPTGDLKAGETPAAVKTQPSAPVVKTPAPVAAPAAPADQPQDSVEDSDIPDPVGENPEAPAKPTTIGGRNGGRGGSGKVNGGGVTI